MKMGWYCCGFLALVAGRVEANATRPNVILVMADDLGIGDISPTNSECAIPTPHLQRMAEEGVTFVDAHSSSAVCTPTRYGLLTGRYNWRSRLARGVLNGYSGPLIPGDRPTLGHLMRTAGYRTTMIGKWHLGWTWRRQSHAGEGDRKAVDFTAPVTEGPDQNGFDTYFAIPASLDMPPYVWVDSGTITAAPDREEGVLPAEDRYAWYRRGPIGADFQVDEVLPTLFARTQAFVREHAKDPNGPPFFVYLALPAPHTPIVPVPPYRDATGINPYADFVHQIDASMGQLFETLAEMGCDESTLVIFTSDNGCSPQANFELLAEHGHHPSGIYRGHKADIYEGGHRVPLLARWPGQIPGGRTSMQLACLTDIYATLAAVTQSGPESKTPDADSGGEDSFSLWPLLRGDTESSSRETLISHSVSGHFAIRRGPWKLCLCAGSGGWSAPTEKVAAQEKRAPLQLFHLEQDPAETENLLDEHPNVVQELLDRLGAEIEQGRSRPGPPAANDREVTFLPEGYTRPALSR